ncbi:MAG: sigma-70 family RNA polymerase sigma factor [Vicinamibacterales bacterium]
MTDLEHNGAGGVWAAFEAEAMPHVDRLFRLAVWWERDKTEAEDLVQDTLVQALRSFHRYTIGTNCRAWLITILQHVRLNRHRARRREPLVEDPGDRLAGALPFVPAVPQHLTDDELLAALGDLPEVYRDVILLCDVEELSYKDIAQALGIPLGTVMSRLHRGRGLLRRTLAARRAGGEADGVSRGAVS